MSHLTPAGTSIPFRLSAASALLEKGGPKDHFAIYLLPEGPCSVGRALLYVLQNDTLGRTIPLVNGSKEPFYHA